MNKPLAYTNDWGPGLIAPIQTAPVVEPHQFAS